MAETIFRAPTENERKEMKILGERDLKTLFREKSIEKEQDCTMRHKPYCARCAKLDFEDKVSNTMKELVRNNSGKALTKEDVEKMYNVDLDVYADLKRFKILRTVPVKADKLLDGIRTSVLVGKNIDYKCEKRGCNITVFIPKEDEFLDEVVADEKKKAKPKIVTTT